MLLSRQKSANKVSFNKTFENYNQALIYLTSEIQKSYGFFMYRAIHRLQKYYGLTGQDITKVFGFSRQNLSKLAAKYKRDCERSNI